MDVEFDSAFGMKVAWVTGTRVPRWSEPYDFPAKTPWYERKKEIMGKVPCVPYRNGSWIRSLAAIKACGGARAVIQIPQEHNPELSPLRTTILVEESRWAFVPIYKSGYSSFRTFCFDRFREFKDADRSNSAALNTLMDPRHTRFTSFSFVRSPYERFLSFYRDKMLSAPGSVNDTEFGQPIRVLADGGSLFRIAEFVAAVPDSHSDPHWRSQFSTLLFGGVPLVDRIYHLEAAQAALQKLWPGESLPKFPHVLRSSRRKYDDSSWAEASRIVRKRYERDLWLVQDKALR